MQRKKPAKLMWTQSWRRLNKKGKDENLSKRKAKRVIKIQRAIVGASLDEVFHTQIPYIFEKYYFIFIRIIRLKRKLKRPLIPPPRQH